MLTSRPRLRTDRLLSVLLCALGAIAASGCGAALASGGAAPAPGPRAGVRGEQRIYWRMGDYIDARDYGFEELIVVPGAHIYDPGARDTGRWTRRDKTDRYLARTVPADYDGLIALDWEGRAMRVLSDPESPEFAAVRSDFLALLWHVKRERPRARVGYYGLPFREYWNQDEKWIARNDAIASIIAAGDVVFPSCYDFYGAEPQRDAERFGRIVAEALRVADGRPVIPWVMPQYHNSSKKWGVQRIPDAEYIAHIRSLLAVEVDGDRIDGICVFGSNYSAYKTAFTRQAGGEWKNTQLLWQQARRFYDTEMRPGETIESFCRRFHAHVACITIEAVRGEKCRDGYEPGNRGTRAE